jgi:hypothetical protein
MTGGRSARVLSAVMGPADRRRGVMRTSAKPETIFSEDRRTAERMRVFPSMQFAIGEGKERHAEINRVRWWLIGVLTALVLGWVKLR